MWHAVSFIKYFKDVSWAEQCMPTVAAATGQGLWLQALHRLLWICDVLACIRQERGYVDIITAVSEAHTHTHTRHVHICTNMHK